MRSLKSSPVDVAGQAGHFQIIHAGAFERPVGKIKTCWLDDIDTKSQTGGQPQNGAGITGNIGLVKGNAQTGFQRLVLFELAVLWP